MAAKDKVLVTEHSDSQLIAACIAGHSWAWESLVDRYKRLVYSVALRTGLDQEDAGDVFQTVFTLLVQNVDTIRDPQGLGAWLITTTKRQAWRLLQKRRREVPDENDPQDWISDDGWLHHAHPDENLWVDQSIVRDALATLDGRCKDLIYMLYYDQNEPSYDDISAELEMPLGSVGPTRARCLQKLRLILRTMGIK